MTSLEQSVARAEPAGWRERLAGRGIEFDFYATQFFQGIASGGLEQEWEYGGKLDLLTGLEGEKLGLWKGFLVDLHVESRLGKTVNDIDGLLAPSNIAMSFPEPEGNLTALTGLKLTQAISENVAFFAGKINTLDEFPIRYNSSLGLGRPGVGGFMNTSLVFNPICTRTVPYAAAGVGVVLLSDQKPVFSLSVFDPDERATRGLSDLYERGVVIMPDAVLRIQPFGLRGEYNFGGSYSNAEYTSIDPAAWLDIPTTGGPFPEETGSWSLYLNFFQAFWTDPENDGRSWGLFGTFGLADGNPSPFRYTNTIGIGGVVARQERPIDTFGIGLVNLGLSGDFKALLAGIEPRQNEYGLEIFYNYALRQNLRATADLQIMRPSTVGIETTFIPALRIEAVY